MTHAAIAAGFDRELFYFIEIEIGATVYRYCTARELVPVGLDAIPCLQDAPNTSPAEVDPTGGPGIRASVSCNLNDFADQTNGGANYWPAWRAANPYYEGRRISVFSGFVQGDLYDPANFVRRDYVIEKFSMRTGGASFTGKDPLKLASNNKAQIPAASRGSLVAPLAAGATSATLQPSGIGSTYPASGFVRVRSEVMGFTRTGDALTLTRAQYNTTQGAHSAGDTVQICQIFSASVADIQRDILIAAGVPSSYIPIAAWRAEAEIYLPGNYSAILTEPVGATTLLKEMGEQAPHLLFWNDRTNLIEFVAVKAPPASSNSVTWRDHIVAGSFSVEDDPASRVTRVFVYFGQFDPTKKLDDPSNYRQTFIRVDPTAESNYGGSAIKTVFSRWISTVNKAAAIRLAARIGRRFYNTPRRTKFKLDIKDLDVWTGTAVRVDHPMLAGEADFQILSAAERPGVVNYSALEYLYGPGVPEDDDADATGKLIVLSGELYNVNLRAVFDSIYPSYDPADDVRFIFDLAAEIGSTSTAAASVVTGSWPGLITPPLLDVRGYIAGAGGRGAMHGGVGTPGHVAATAGGVAILLEGPIRLNNTGIIGGGGGGGGGAALTGARVPGGGGAGKDAGQPGAPTPENPEGNAGGRELGGAGVSAMGTDSEGFPAAAQGGAGGDLGQAGEDGLVYGGGADISPGAAGGLAIQRNGFTITPTGAGTGDTRGGIV
jgi:hypothetical protein